MKKLPIYRKKLSNGLDVIVMKNGSIPSISINLTYRVGSKDEKIGRRGFAHLFEHLMFEGSKNLPKGEFDKLCSLAGDTNVYHYLNRSGRDSDDIYHWRTACVLIATEIDSSVL